MSSISVRPGVDVDALAAFLSGEGLCDGPVTARPIGDGHSNLTYLVDDGARRVVVRRPPPPPLPPGAHDVRREARVIAALDGSGVPVARVLAEGASGSPFSDAPCYVMEYVEGLVAMHATPDVHASAPARRAIAEQLVDVLAALHDVDWRAAGLEGFGRPDGSNAHLLRRYQHLASGASGDLAPAMAGLAEWLTAHVPAESRASIVHGDYRIGNVMLSAAGEPRILAVLDWELATIGDPLMDIGYFLACYAEPGEPLHPVAELGSATAEDGYPTRAELADRYAATTGRDLANLRWYTVLHLYKLAAMYDYKRRRGDDPYYAAPGMVDRFLDAAHRALGS